MNKRGRRAQLQISFGMIFSIIIIVATLAVAGYVLAKFVNLGGNVSCKIFYDDLQKEIDKAWSGDGATSDIFSGRVPRGVDKVCFGNFSTAASASDRQVYEELKFYSSEKGNLFFYPTSENECDNEGFVYILNHVSITKFFCVSEKDRKAEIKISKSVTDALITLKA